MRSSLFALLPFLASVCASPTDSSSTLVVTSSPLSGCFLESYYGTYGGKGTDHIYMPSTTCLETESFTTSTSGSLIPLPSVNGGRLVWIGQAGVEGSPKDIWADWASIEDLSSVALLEFGRSQIDDRADQKVFSDNYSGIAGLELVHAFEESLLVRVPDVLMGHLDTLLPAHLVPVALPRSPLPLSTIGTAEWKSVPREAAEFLGNISQHLKFDPKISTLVGGISHDDVRRNVRWLTGEALSGIDSRHSFTAGAIKAAHWIQKQTEATGASCTLEPFLPGFAPNVICTYPSTTNSTSKVIVSAHFDSRGSWGSTIAPGGDDDGSGSGHLLAVAQAIGRSGVQFKESVVLAFFAGEEQGLLGSHAYAEKLYNDKETVLFHLQADMLGYHVPGEPLQLGLPESIHLPEATYVLGNLSHIYSPELLVGRTAACCSDHQSFLSFGFPATALFERNGPIADPMYHNTGDVSSREGYDFDQIVSIAKVTLAAILTLGGYSRE